MSLFLYILVLGMWSKVLGTCMCLERLTLYVFISVYSGFRHVVKSFGYMYMCLERLTLYVFVSVYSGFRHVVKSFGYMFMS